MKSVKKIIIHFVLVASLIALLLVAINFGIYLIWGHYNSRDNDPREASIIAMNLRNENGSYILEKSYLDMLHKNYKWAMLINQVGHVVWSDNLPNDVPLNYSVQEIVDFTHWYLNDYPVTVCTQSDGLLVLGKEKSSEWKKIIEVPTETVNNLPLWIILALLLNILFALGLSSFFGIILVRYLKPLVKGIESLERKEVVTLSKKGIFGDLEYSINHTSEELHNQDIVLKKRDTSRRNWISGISHDIRTPLSAILAYSSDIKEYSFLPEEIKAKASVIEYNSLKIKQLVNDLNLVSKLEYNMQPLHMERISLSALMRQEVADIINNNLDEKYTIEYVDDQNVDACKINGDKALLKRAFQNIIQNSIIHNPKGCIIKIALSKEENNIRIQIVDDGIGVSKEKLKKLDNKSHYINCDDSTVSEQHGLGLLIVKQIIEAHKGTVRIESSENNGFGVIMHFSVLY